MIIKRPIIPVSISFAFGILLEYLFELNFKIYIILIIIDVIIMVCLLYNKRQTFFVVLLLFILVGALRLSFVYAQLNPYENYYNTQTQIYAIIVEEPQHFNDKTIYILRPIKINKKEIETRKKIQMTVYNNNCKKTVSSNNGDIISYFGIINQPSARRNPKCFDYREYLKRKNIYGLISSSKDIRNIGHINLPFYKQVLTNINRYCKSCFSRYVGGDEGKLLSGMIIGNKKCIPSSIRDEFSKTGIAHLLAISGLHVSFIAVLINTITKKLRLSVMNSVLIILLILWLYAFVVGMPVSVFRANIMISIVLIGKVIGRDSDMLNSLCLAALIILIINPMNISDPGFQLSFAAVLGLAVFYNKLVKKTKSFPLWLSQSLAAIISVQSMIWPITAYHFNILSIISIPFNLVIIPLAGIIVGVAFIFLLIGFIPILNVGIGFLLKCICGFLIELTSFVQNMPFSFIDIISPTILFLIIYYIILFIYSSERPKLINRPVLCSAVLLTCLILTKIIAPIIDNDFKVVFLDVGQGDCSLIKTPDEKYILIDAGGREGAFSKSDFDTGKDIVVPYLLKNGINHIDLVIMSHEHDDHIGGLKSVISSIRVDCFMEYPPKKPSHKYIELKKLLISRNIKQLKAYRGDCINIGKEIRFDVLFPLKDDYVMQQLYDNDENNNSLVIKFQYGEADVLFTGDMEAIVEGYLCSYDDLDADILKVPHHGSLTSSTYEFIRHVSPSLAVIQVGRNNMFGHPCPEVINRYNELKIDVLRNDICGAVTCIYNKGRWKYKSMLNTKSIYE